MRADWMWLALLALGPACAQAPAREAAVEAPSAARFFERFAIVGASLSDSFRADPGWEDALDAVQLEPGNVVATSTDVMFFTNPIPTAERQLAAVLEKQPDLIVGLDFLFWFGYGEDFQRGQPLTSEADRLQLLEKGLALLEDVPCTLLLADFPDMSHAVGHLLKAEQMPELTTLEALNRRLAEWAARSPQRIVLPFSRWMAQVRSGQPMRVGSREVEPAALEEWFNRDRLHPTSAGDAALATLMQDFLVSSRRVAPGGLRTDPDEVLARMRGLEPVAIQASEATDAERSGD